jgi:hypothetical protein
MTTVFLLANLIEFNYMDPILILSIVGAISFTVLLFIFIRAGVLWYWKIDRIVENLEYLTDDVKRIADKIATEENSDPS